MTITTQPWLRKAVLVFLHIINLFVILSVAQATIFLTHKLGWWTFAVICILAIIKFAIYVSQGSFSCYFVTYLGFILAITVGMLVLKTQPGPGDDALVLIMAIPAWYTAYITAHIMYYVYTRLHKR